MYLILGGEVVIDHEEDRSARPADPAERDFALPEPLSAIPSSLI
jgi:hypothetical protein